MTERNELTKDERALLDWLGPEVGQYGECHGATLDSLIGKGLARVLDGQQYQMPFIAKGNSKMHQAVTLTEAGLKLWKNGRGGK